MNVGRAAAQASHASNAFIHSHGKEKGAKTWQNSTTQGFGTAIILSASSEQIRRILLSAHSKRLPASWVWDPEYGMPVTKEIYELMPQKVNVCPPIYKEDGTVVFFRSVDTCAYIFGKKSELVEILGELPLFP